MVLAGNNLNYYRIAIATLIKGFQTPNSALLNLSSVLLTCLRSAAKFGKPTSERLAAQLGVQRAHGAHSWTAARSPSAPQPPARRRGRVKSFKTLEKENRKVRSVPFLLGCLRGVPSS